MPSSTSRQTVRPVIVEVKPSDAGRTNDRPQSPPSTPSSPSTKKARFAQSPVAGMSKELSRTEAWSLYHFEMHARGCAECYDPFAVHLRGHKLCRDGQGLAHDVAEHVYYRQGEVYSRSASDDGVPVRAELPPGYFMVRGLLKAIDRATQLKLRNATVVVDQSNPPTLPRRRSSSEKPDNQRERRKEQQRPRTVIIEPSDSRRSHHKSSQKSRRYSTVAVEEDIPTTQPLPQAEPQKDSRRGSMYEAEIRRQKKEKDYIVEIREPSSRHRDHDRRRYYD